MSRNTGITLIGIGGAGCRIANYVASVTGGGMRAVAVDTDFSEIGQCQLCQNVRLGEMRFSGYGSGGSANLARMAAEEESETIRGVLNGISVAVIITGLGGGTGSGVTPAFLRAAREMNVRTLVFAMLPFSFEGADRIKTAQMACPQLDESGDVVVMLENDKLTAELKDIPVADAFRKTTAVVESGLTLLWRLVTMSGYIKIDPSVLSEIIMKGRGRAVFASAKSEGPSRMEKAVADLMDHSSMGIRTALSSARGMLVGIIGGEDMRLKEIGDAMATLDYQKNASCCVNLGTVFDAGEDGSFSIVTLVFSGWSEISSDAAVTHVENASSGLEPAAPRNDSVIELPHPVRGGEGGSKSGTGKGKRFAGLGELIYRGEDLNIPTYKRRKILIDDK